MRFVERTLTIFYILNYIIVTSYLKCIRPLVSPVVTEARHFCLFLGIILFFDDISVISRRSYDSIFSFVRRAIDSVELSSGKSAIIIFLRIGEFSRVLSDKLAWIPSGGAMCEEIQTIDSPTANFRDVKIRFHSIEWPLKVSASSSQKRSHLDREFSVEARTQNFIIGRIFPKVFVCISRTHARISDRAEQPSIEWKELRIAVPYFRSGRRPQSWSVVYPEPRTTGLCESKRTQWAAAQRPMHFIPWRENAEKTHRYFSSTCGCEQ